MKMLVLLFAFILSFVSLTSANGLTGSGLLADPYQISTAAELDLVRNYLGTAYQGTYFKLMNDIDLTTYLASGGAGYGKWGTYGWLPIGDNSEDHQFFGVFDGNNFKIIGLYISRSAENWVGLFGILGNSTDLPIVPTVKNLGIVIDASYSVAGKRYVGGLVGQQDIAATISNCYVSGSVYASDGSGGYVGGLVGYAGGKVENCYSTGSVSGTWDVGGLIGKTYGDQRNIVVACYSTSSVSGTNNLGGLVGSADGPGNTEGGAALTGIIMDCFARGSVTSTNNNWGVGGLVGGNRYCSVNRCYSTGLVTSSFATNVGGLFGTDVYYNPTNSFWDKQTSGRTTSPGSNATVVGKLTADMKTQSTFTDAGWNFSTTWAMNAGINDGYPYLTTIPLSPLPVELTTFTASAEKNGVTLNWQTATEVNNFGFDIERKSTGGWNKVGFVEGHGTTNAPQEYHFADHSASGNVVYRLKQIDRDGKFEYSKVVEAIVTTPTVFALSQNYPNPFNPSTLIGYSVASASNVALKVYDLLGREVAVLVNAQMAPGTYTAEFNASRLSTGVYFYRLDAGSFSDVKRLSIMK